MKHSFSLACVVLALALAFALVEQHDAGIAHAAPSMSSQAMTASASSYKQQATTQTRKANSEANSTPEPVVREVDLEAFKKLFERGPEKDARPLLINFWATWCVPCREEFPDLVRINADYGKRNLDLITISLDEPEDTKTKVPAFLREMRAPMPAYLLNVIDPQIVIDMIDPNWRGGLPATFLYDASGKQVFRHTGRFDVKELRAALDKVTTGK
jgi:thiol-disulfide isomerase/thioredoxin